MDQKILLQCPAKYYRQLKDACGGQESTVKEIFDCIAGNIIDEEESNNNYIIYDNPNVS